MAEFTLTPELKRQCESRGLDWATATTCPLCRGYNVERRWCSHCNATGYVSARTRTEGETE